MAWNWFRSRARNPTEQLVLGERGEDFAARFLRRRGYKVLVRRFKSRGGEIDIVCRDRDWLVFVEVKTRETEEFGAPSESVQREKQRHLSKAALDYLRLLDNPRIHWRFDVVEVLLRQEARQPDDLRLIRNAFDLSEPFIY
ncbi:MAG TPA: YraN family protein [Verrucomicrobiae bacterium]|nr:YraN family protein [Verrucomicrobiae bacterium]